MYLRNPSLSLAQHRARYGTNLFFLFFLPITVSSLWHSAQTGVVTPLSATQLNFKGNRRDALLCTKPKSNADTGWRGSAHRNRPYNKVIIEYGVSAYRTRP